MTVTKQEIDDFVGELKAYEPEQPIDRSALDFTTAEWLGFTIAQLRAAGLTPGEVLHGIELILRSVLRIEHLPREDLLEARGVLRKLHYGPDIAALLTRIARIAKPREPTFIERLEARAQRSMRG